MFLSRFIQRTKRSCEDCIKDVIYGKRFDAKARRLARFFYLLSFPFYGIVYAREKAYRKRFLRGHHLGCMVIVVGNLTVGGTGKTPIVEKLAKTLQQRGRKVAVLSRGYKSKKESFWKKWWHWLIHAEPCPPKIVSDGQSCLLPYEEAGDEPLLLAQNLPNVCVVVDRDRVKAGRFAIKNLNCDTLVLDDGFQYFQLKGTFYILLIDATHPFGNGAILPRGILREPLRHMRRAQFIFLTKSDQVPQKRLKALARFIRRYTQVPILPCVHSPKHLQAINALKTEIQSLSFLKGRRVAALSAIAAPKSFEKFLEDGGAEIVYKEHFLDHHRYTKTELEEFFKKAIQFGAECAITTEKDAVRINDTLPFPLPFYFLRMEIEFTGEFRPLFEKVLQKLSNVNI